MNAQGQAEQESALQGISVLNDLGQARQASIPQGILEVNAQEQAEHVRTPHGIPLTSQFNTSASTTSAQGVKLPKAQLPKFRDVAKFQAFW